MTPEQLKASILQYAIQGKLVEQRAEEGTAEELYQQIQAEKQQLIKDGKIKKEKPLAEITEDEIPFDIPDDWKWVRLKAVCTKIVDGDHNPPAGIKEPSEYLMLSATNINKDTIVDLEKVRYLSKEVFEARSKRTNVSINDVLLTIVGSMGRSCVYKGGYNICFQRSVSVITTRLIPEYLKLVLDAPYIQSFIYANATGSIQKGFYLKQVENLVIPLPPLEEQHRIVAKVQQLMPLVDRYAASYEELEHLNAKFPEDMKKSILQYAIQGKLVEQRPEEGTAEELYRQIQADKKIRLNGKKENKLSPETFKEDEIPYDIPETWKWVRFGHIMINRDAERVPLSVTQRKPMEKIYDYYGASGVIDKVDGYLFNDKLLLIGEDGANLLLRSTPIAFLAEGEYWVNNHAHVLDCNKELVCMEYIMYYINAISLASYVTGIAQPKMNQEKMNSIPIALPPYKEQHRIVAKIQQLLPYCHQLIK